MNTAAQANPLEDSIFNIIQYILKNDRLGLTPTQTKLFRKKSYFSLERKANVVTDIAIEVWPSQAKNYSMLWICELKTYSRINTVADLEDLKAHLSYIGGKNIKGVLASANALQQSALDYARSNGIGIIRMLPNTQVRWNIHDSATPDTSEERINLREIANGLTSQNYMGNNHNLYAFYDGRVFDELKGFLSLMLKT